MNNCSFCNKKMIKFKDDWRGRKYHRFCYRKITELHSLQVIIENYQKEHSGGRTSVP